MPTAIFLHPYNMSAVYYMLRPHGMLAFSRGICRLIHHSLRTQSRQHAIYILLLLCMDVSMQSSTTLLRIVQETIEALICHIFDNHELATVVSDFSIMNSFSLTAG